MLFKSSPFKGIDAMFKIDSVEGILLSQCPVVLEIVEVIAESTVKVVGAAHIKMIEWLADDRIDARDFWDELRIAWIWNSTL